MANKRYGNLPESAATVREQPDHFIQETWTAARHEAERRLTEITTYTRQSPEKALLYALAAGYVLRILPTTQILGGVIRLALLLMKPAAFIYGGAKLWQKTQETVRPPRRQ